MNNRVPASGFCARDQYVKNAGRGDPYGNNRMMIGTGI